MSAAVAQEALTALLVSLGPLLAVTIFSGVLATMYPEMPAAIA